MKILRLTKHFSRDEVKCPCCGICNIRLELLNILEAVRDKYDEPIHINSGTRCVKHNEKVGGSSTSSHLRGLAIDIKCNNSTARGELLPLLINKFSRVGIYKNFIHVDIDYDKPQRVIWVKLD